MRKVIVSKLSRPEVADCNTSGTEVLSLPDDIKCSWKKKNGRSCLEIVKSLEALTDFQTMIQTRWMLKTTLKIPE